MQPESLAHHQLDSLPGQRDSQPASQPNFGCCRVLATSGQLQKVLCVRDARLNQGTCPLRWALPDRAHNPLLLANDRDSRVRCSLSKGGKQ